MRMRSRVPVEVTRGSVSPCWIGRSIGVGDPPLSTVGGSRPSLVPSLSDRLRPQCRSEEDRAMATAFLCAACGTQFAEAESPPERCALCEDSRAFGSPCGARQRWTTLADLRATHRNRLCELEAGVVSITTEPWFGVGQQGLLVRGASGNVLW